MMDLYSHLMDIDEVVEYLNEKTNRDFTKDKTIKFIKEKKIPIVFEYEGWGTQEFQHKSGHQSLNIQVNGYFNFRNASDAIHIFKGFLKEINIDEAIIYQLDSYCIRSNAPDGIAPKEDDKILFKTGGRSPLFSNSNTPNFIKIDNDKVGVLKEDLEECLSKIQIEHMDNKTKIETREFEIERLKNENASLIQEHTEVLTADDAKNEQQERDINNLNDQLSKQSSILVDTQKKEGQGDSLLILGAVMHCIKDAAKKNYTQELLTQTILTKYKSISGISESTLKKKFSEAKGYLEQRLTP